MSRQFSLESYYDTVIIGAGLGGLSCGAYLAKGGKSVLICEQQSRPGGYCVGYSSPTGKFQVELSLQYLMMCDEGNWVDVVLRELGVRDRINFKLLDKFLRIIGPDYDVTLTHDHAQTECELVSTFPSEEKKISRLMRDARQLSRLTHIPIDSIELMSRRDKISTFLQMLPISSLLKRYGTMTVMDGIQMFHDPRFQAFLFSLVPRPEAAFFATLLMLSLTLVWLPSHGGANALVKVFLDALRENNGTIACNTLVRRICVNNGRAVGVELANGQRINAESVVSNADAHLTFMQMLSPKDFHPRFLNELEQRPIAPSIFSVWLGVDLDLHSFGHTTGRVIYNPTHDLSALIDTDPMQCSLTVNMYSLDDPSVAPPHHHTVLIQALFPYNYNETWGVKPDGTRGECYQQIKNDVANALIKSAETILPSLSQHVLEREITTPLTYERYTLNKYGSIHGWLQTPEWVFSQASQRTPVKRLYQAGHWIVPGGIPSVIRSGRNAAKLVLADL
jgi:prolycopene isomerase